MKNKKIGISFIVEAMEEKGGKAVVRVFVVMKELYRKKAAARMLMPDPSSSLARHSSHRLSMSTRSDLLTCLLCVVTKLFTIRAAVCIVYTDVDTDVRNF